MYSVFRKLLEWNSFIDIPKISVVIPTYNTRPEALKRLIESIDQQTMPANEYEIVFVDDGSTTDIFDRLQKESKRRKNMIVKKIPNSGWGSRPRNVGTSLARGEYILFMDHDDTVFPEAFERAYRFGKEHKADVINGKEARTKGWAWGWEQFKVNNPKSEELGVSALLPMTPHKFYRRKFLLENDIKFDEGARVLWEDVYFNTKVYASGARVATLSDYPTYYWIATGENNSNSFGSDPHEKWAQLRKLLLFFRDTFEEGDDLSFMLAHWYRTRILKVTGPWMLNKKEQQLKVELNYAQKLTEDLIPPFIDDLLPPFFKIRSYFLRRGMYNELRKLAECRGDITARSYASSVRWVEDTLEIKASAVMTNGEKEDVVFERQGDRIKLHYPKELMDKIPDELLDVTDFMKQSTYEASIKDRTSRVTWWVPTEESSVTAEELTGNRARLVGNLKVHIPIDRAAMGLPLANEPCDVAARFTALGMTSHRGIVAPMNLGVPALINGRTAVAYRNKSELLTIDIGSKVRSVVGSSAPKQEDLIIQKEKNKYMIKLDLGRVHVFGETKLEGTIELTSQKKKFTFPASLIGDKEGARVVATVKLPKGNYEVATVFEGRRSPIKLTVQAN